MGDPLLPILPMLGLALFAHWIWYGLQKNLFQKRLVSLMEFVYMSTMLVFTVLVVLGIFFLDFSIIATVLAGSVGFLLFATIQPLIQEPQRRAPKPFPVGAPIIQYPVGQYGPQRLEDLTIADIMELQKKLHPDIFKGLVEFLEALGPVLRAKNPNSTYPQSFSPTEVDDGDRPFR